MSSVVVHVEKHEPRVFVPSHTVSPSISRTLWLCSSYTLYSSSSGFSGSEEEEEEDTHRTVAVRAIVSTLVTMPAASRARRWPTASRPPPACSPRATTPRPLLPSPQTPLLRLEEADEEGGR